MLHTQSVPGGSLIAVRADEPSTCSHHSLFSDEVCDVVDLYVRVHNGGVKET